jgi:hypothetical protein
MVSSKRKVILVFIALGIAFLLSNPHVIPPPCAAIEIWADDFNDGNYDGWTIWASNTTGFNPWTNVTGGSFEIDDGALRANGTNVEWNLADYPSSVAYGTWSFDLDIVDTWRSEFGVQFFKYDTTPRDGPPGQCYDLVIVTEFLSTGVFDVRLIHRNDQSSFSLGRTVINGFSGWYHFDVTRDTNGQFYVYINTTYPPILDGVDDAFTTCNTFTFWAPFGPDFGPAIDNIRVSNTIDVDRASPKFTEGSPQDITIQFGQPLSYEINATDSSPIDQFWINDTTNFAITTNGVFTNATTLSIGSYPVTVSVNDTLGHTQTASFTVTVQPVPPPPPPPIPGFPIETILLGLVTVIGIGLLYRRRKHRKTRG